ncbi:papain family cysteine protease [Ancylostoma duodenale]|uniref:Papain family cysteine protease n=1 Tax=Ancylostoma duodenale TaxID=51022 RepID=A0A0C2CZP7_9BILA|nr:papain family cysteine protease [Ancylostoma duodenale]
MWVLVALAVTAFTAKPTTDFLAQPVEKHAEQLTGRDFVDYINEHQLFYRAEYSPEAEAFVKSRIMDSKFLVERTKEEVLSDVLTLPEPPESSPILASTLASNGQNADPSASSVINHAVVRQMEKCEGGWPIEAFRWMGSDGVVTGGKYRQKTLRMHVGHTLSTRVDIIGMNRIMDRVLAARGPHQHVERLVNSNTMFRMKMINTLLISSTLSLARASFYLPEDEKRIRQEIVMNGPLVATFKVYQDFSFYKSGIYVHKWGAQTGAHAVKVVGWGRENGTDYWLIANSWNTDWGEDGYFRMVRGTNNCEIEKDTVSAWMKV